MELDLEGIKKREFVKFTNRIVFNRLLQLVEDRELTNEKEDVEYLCANTKETKEVVRRIEDKLFNYKEKPSYEQVKSDYEELYNEVVFEGKNILTPPNVYFKTVSKNDLKEFISESMKCGKETSQNTLVKLEGDACYLALNLTTVSDVRSSLRQDIIDLLYMVRYYLCRLDHLNYAPIWEGIEEEIIDDNYDTVLKNIKENCEKLESII